jgi:Holliday junction resolvase
MYDTCPKKCTEEGWGWDLRVSSRLYDGSGSIKMVLTKDIASRILNRNLGELILLASQDKPLTQNNLQQASSVKIKIPESIEIIEAVTENASSYRSNVKLITTDGRNLVFFPPELEQEEAHKFTEHIKRPLKTSDVEDRKIIKKLLEKALDISIKKVTGMRMMQGIYLLEEPTSLYRCERAKLYLGFSLRIGLIEDNQVTVEATPQAYVRESVLDYVKLRRERGATANAVIRNLLTYRNKVIVAPSGNYGCIVEVVTTKAANQRVSETDNRNLVEFWKQVYGIDISPDEIPLLKVKMMNSENVFTYPPSMCFFGSESLLIYANVQRFIENKKYSLKSKVEDAVRKAVQEQGLHIGSAKLEVSEESSASLCSDVQSQLLHEIRQKLFGRNATARGSIIFVHDELWFFPNQIQLS